MVALGETQYMTRPCTYNSLGDTCYTILWPFSHDLYNHDFWVDITNIALRRY